jgi:hypothetical protein
MPPTIGTRVWHLRRSGRKYIELQQLCLQYVPLDVCDSPLENPKALTVEQEKQAESLLLLRIGLFERAYLMYRRTSHLARQNRWAGWERDLLELWFTRENFRAAWKTYSRYYDAEFIKEYSKYAE